MPTCHAAARPRRLRLHRGPVILWAAGIAAATCLRPTAAAAHIKWFAAYDVTETPQPIGDVLNAPFLLALAGFALLMAGGFLLDRMVAGSGRAGPLLAPRDGAEGLLRAGIGGFFMALFAMGGVILTPELRTMADWPAWLQLAIAASLVRTRGCALGGVGILVLYGYGIREYGLFHMTDYPIFPGIAACLILTASRRPWLRELRMPILYASVCGSLMWVAIEKWAYPQWTYPLLAARPYLTLGIPAEEFMVLAGFVEFALAFTILTGLGLVRPAIFGLGAIFGLAIVDFGKIDAIGHLPTLTAMAAMFLHGPTALHEALHDARRSLAAEAPRAGAAFVGAIGLFFVAYYGLQHGEYGNHVTLHRLAAVQGTR